MTAAVQNAYAWAASEQEQRRTAKTLERLLVYKNLVVYTTQDINTRLDNQYKHITQKKQERSGVSIEDSTHDVTATKLPYLYAAKYMINARHRKTMSGWYTYWDNTTVHIKTPIRGENPPRLAL